MHLQQTCEVVPSKIRISQLNWWMGMPKLICYMLIGVHVNAKFSYVAVAHCKSKSRLMLIKEVHLFTYCCSI